MNKRGFRSRWMRVEGTAGPSTSLPRISSGRDDKFVGSERLNCRSLGYPGFPVEVGGVAIFMRFSLQKTAHAALSSAASRKSGYAPDEQDGSPRKHLILGGGNCRFLGYARNDKGESSALIGCGGGNNCLWMLFIPLATCRRQDGSNDNLMDVVHSSSKEQQVLPLRYAPVGMTIHFLTRTSP
jgi:hypothetical protein